MAEASLLVILLEVVVDHREGLALLVMIVKGAVVVADRASRLLHHLTVIKAILGCNLLEVLLVLGCQTAD